MLASKGRSTAGTELVPSKPRARRISSPMRFKEHTPKWNKFRVNFEPGITYCDLGASTSLYNKQFQATNLLKTHTRENQEKLKESSKNETMLSGVK